MTNQTINKKPKLLHEGLDVGGKLYLGYILIALSEVVEFDLFYTDDVLGAIIKVFHTCLGDS